ncbi:MAG: phosphopentomutase [Rhodospirillales bacterium]
MSRAFILMMDSFGVGATEDAVRFGDEGADTFGHIAKACADGSAGRGPLLIPNLTRLGLVHAGLGSTGKVAAGCDASIEPEGIHGHAAERSLGKDTPSGHWELAGVPVEFEWGYFPRTEPCFPPELIDRLVAETGIPGVLGDRHASGTVIIEQLGEEHVRTGRPIVYTSADSVFQIAAHEEYFGLERLYEICLVARRIVDDWNIGRVIARPFVGATAADFKRTGNRRDYATPPPAPTLLDRLEQAGREVVSIGKIADIFAHKGLTRKVKADGNAALFDATIDLLEETPDGGLVFTNFVDFDSSYGHRRNVAGYADAIEAFDRRLPDFEAAMQPGDIAVITADHGCDPTWPGSDHTREHVPVLVFGPGIKGRDIGRRKSFADIGQSLAAHLGIAPLAAGESFL